MATRSAARDWTVARLHALPDDGNRYEIIDGVLYVTPAPAAPHQWVLGNLYGVLRPYAHAVGLSVLFAPADIEYSGRTLVQPDLFAFANPSGEAPRTWADVQPLVLALEALSPSTRRRDRTVKRDLYLREGVPEYWVVDPFARVIERYTRDGVERFDTRMTWHPVAAHPPLNLDVAAVFR